MDRHRSCGGLEVPRVPRYDRLREQLPDRVRRVTMVASIVLACGVWLLVRQDGMNGDHNASFGWRWSQSAEERLLAQTAEALPAEPPATSSATPASSTAPSPSASTAPATEAPKESTAPATPARAEAEWPGFRGPRRDGVVRGVKIKTDWSASPPAQIWRRAIGPGWSSFAVRGNLIYTQEQRGGDDGDGQEHPGGHVRGGSSGWEGPSARRG